ncbi:MAG: arylsulfatase [Anderseniella sp.]
MTEKEPTDHAQGDKPNIVMMLVDNLGWGELGCYGGGELRGAATPRLDELASEGVRLLNYNVETQCTPSRSAFMTGRHPIRSGTSKVVWGMLYGMTQWERTLPELLSEQGYATGAYGKWHLGNTPGRYPTDQGFDEWYGIANTSDESMYTTQFQYDPDVSEKTIIEKSVKGEEPELVSEYDIPARRRIDAELVNRSVDFMTRSVKAKKPFFAYIPFTQPHLPTLPHPDFDGKTGEGFYADVIAEIDHRVGQVLDAIDDLGIRDNTIVMFTSDNGPDGYPPYHGTAGFWRGTFFTALEGSLRVPFIARWPGKIDAGTTSNEIVHMVDQLPTLARVAGAKVPDDRMIDGVDQLDFLTGKQEKSNREGFPVYNGDELYAYKWRNWKMHFIQLDTIRGIPKRSLMPRVHHLIKDPKEEHDIAVEETWVLPVMTKMIVEFQETLIKEPPIKLGTPDPYVPPGK